MCKCLGSRPTSLMIIIALLILVGLTGCGGLQSTLVGRWRGGDNEVVEFSGDKQAHWSTVLGSFDGYYEIPDSNHINLQMVGFLGAINGNWEVRTDGTNMTWIRTTDGASLRFMKMQK